MSDHLYVAVVVGPSVDRRLVKIGRSIDIARRLAELQTYCPYRLRLLARVDQGGQHEPAFHAMFRHGRLRGEWFELDSSDVLRLEGAIGILGGDVYTDILDASWIPLHESDDTDFIPVESDPIVPFPT